MAAVIPVQGTASTATTENLFSGIFTALETNAADALGQKISTGLQGSVIEQKLIDPYVSRTIDATVQQYLPFIVGGVIALIVLGWMVGRVK
jgi:hypothetical protein